MTSSLPPLAAVPLVIGLMGAPLSGTTAPVPPLRTDPASLVDIVGHTAVDNGAEQRRVLGYWTPERMAKALPAELLGGVGRAVRGLAAAGRGPAAIRHTGAATDPEPAPAPAPAPATVPVSQSRAPAASTAGSRWTAGGSVTRTTGRVFLTLGGVDFVCSASTVRSANKDVVVTAGHCVKDGKGAWADNWTFVPGYQAGRRPHGTFTARRMFVAGPWSRDGDDSYDVGMVALNTSGGKHVTEVVGAQEIAFNGARGGAVYGFGYPADRPYDGQNLVYCAGRLASDPHRQTRDQGLRCDMTAGSSGGPWLSGFDAQSGRGTITSVSSFKYSDDQKTMYGPYFGESAKQLFTTAERA
ncbi:V8-like Glu-specific endopeptidase [Sinosporangium album]|uniref:V8-like Glu-specific endopeptidase n=1 Tax=Sinosporangium album TaxID=504805 RepID=A0A1G7RSC1_9ACTN|nr:trypsin-like serine protease [Sinosporangium album]SDG13605.1 V8-like Glu-specific endopeptidase [Sinosporangium album]